MNTTITMSAMTAISTTTIVDTVPACRMPMSLSMRPWLLADSRVTSITQSNSGSGTRDFERAIAFADGFYGTAVPGAEADRLAKRVIGGSVPAAAFQPTQTSYFPTAPSEISGSHPVLSRHRTSSA